MEIPKDYQPPRGAEEVRVAREALENMVRTDGWKIYKVWMEAQLKQHLKYLTTEVDSNILLRSGGAYAQTKSILDWPELQITEFKRLEEQRRKNEMQAAQLEQER